MADDPLLQFAQNIPADHLDQIHTALNAIRSGTVGGQSFDTSGFDPQKVQRLWTAVDGVVQQRRAAQSEEIAQKAGIDPSFMQRLEGLGTKAMGALNIFPKPPVYQRQGTEGGNYALAPGQEPPGEKPILDIQKLEAPGYRAEHPFVHGLAGGASAMLTPSGIALQMTGLGEGKAAIWATRAFTAMMAKGNYDQAKAFKAAVDKGDSKAAWEAAGEFTATAPFTVLGVGHEILGHVTSPEANQQTGRSPREPAPVAMGGGSAETQVADAGSAFRNLPQIHADPKAVAEARAARTAPPPEPPLDADKLFDAINAKRPGDRNWAEQRTQDILDKVENREGRFNPIEVEQAKSAAKMWLGPERRGGAPAEAYEGMERRQTAPKPDVSHIPPEARMDFSMRDVTPEIVARAVEIEKNKPSGTVMTRVEAVRQALTEAGKYEPEGIVSTTPGPTTQNASGESAASLEAQNRLAAERTAGIQRVRIDTRSGQETPLIGVDAVDAKAGPYDRIVARQNGNQTVLDEGAKARPVKPPKSPVAGPGSLQEPRSSGVASLGTGTEKPLARPGVVADNGHMPSSYEEFKDHYAQKPVAELQARLDEIEKMDGRLKPVEERRALKKVIKDKTPQAPEEPRTPLQEVVQHSLRFANAQDSAEGVRRIQESREFIRENSAQLDPGVLRDAARVFANRADEIGKVLNSQDVAKQISEMRSEAVLTRALSAAESGTEVAGAEEGEVPVRDRPGLSFPISSARRTTLGRLAGNELLLTRAYDPETRRVVNAPDQTPEIAQFVKDSLAAFEEKAKRYIADLRARPGQKLSDSRLADIEQHMEAVEAATGMKAVFSRKGRDLLGVDPAREVLNQMAGRGVASHLSGPVDRLPEVETRLRQRSTFLRDRASEVERLQTGAQPAVAVPQTVEAQAPAAVPAEAVSARPTPTETPLSVPTESASHQRLMAIKMQLESLKDAYAEAGASGQVPPDERGQPRTLKEFGQETNAQIKKLLGEAVGIKKRIDDGTLNMGFNPMAAVRRVLDYYQENREAAGTLAGDVQGAIDSIQYGLKSAKMLFTGTMKAVLGNQVWGDWDDARGRFWNHGRMVEEFRSRFDSGFKQLVPDPMKRVAITNWIQANGDAALLAQRANDSAPRFRKGYELAQNLTPLEQAAANSIRQSYDEIGQRLQQAGVLGDMLENYVNQQWKRVPQEMRLTINDIRSGALKSNPGLAMQRFYESYFAGEQAGLIPRNKDVGFLHSIYLREAEKSLASRALVKNGIDTLEADGRPTFLPAGVGTHIDYGEQDPVNFVNPKVPRTGGQFSAEGYRSVNNPNLRSWQWLQTDPVSGAKSFIKGELLVHPDRYAEVKAMLEGSKIQGNILGQTALKAASTIKQGIFLGTFFHPITLMVHGLESGVPRAIMPWSLPEIDTLANPLHREAVAAGVKLGEYDAAHTFGQPMEESNYIHSIPGFGDAFRWYQNSIFGEQGLQARLKMAAFEKAFNENLDTYRNRLDRGQIASKTADEINARFGGLNYEKFGRSRTVQDLLRLTVIAPDFLEARGRYSIGALNPVQHRAQFQSMVVRGGLLMYAAARIINHYSDQDAHWDPKDAFTIFHNRQTYGFRVAQQDFIDFLDHPKDWLMGRTGPLFNTALEFATGRDNAGFQRTTVQQLQDFLTRTAPIGVEQKLQDSTSGWMSSFLKAMGVRHGMQHTAAETLALQYRAQAIPRGPQGAEETQRLKLLRNVRNAYTQGDSAAADKLLGEGIDRGILAETDADKLDKSQDQEYLPQLMKGLRPEEALEVYSKASESERASIEDQVEAKVSKALDSPNYSEAVRRRIEKRANEVLK